MYRILAALIALLVATPAFAQQAPWANRTAAIQKHSADYGESPVAIGLTADGNVLEVLASDKGSWTILVTTQQGVGCGVASGEAWSKAPDRPAQRPNVGL